MSVYTSNGRRYSKRIRFMSDKKRINPNSHKLDECCENGIYKIKEYGGKCSKCLKHSNPELFKKEIADKNNDLDNPFYSNEVLEEVTRLIALPFDHYLFKSLKFIFQNGSIETIDGMKQYIGILSGIRESKYEGWTAKQATELTTIFRFKHCNNSWDGMGMGGEKWRIQHAICGGVIDKWNLKSDEVGPIGYCYYAIPKPQKFQIVSEYCKVNNPIPTKAACFSAKDNKNRFSLWFRNIPHSSSLL
jgi:hypothetical protein